MDIRKLEILKELVEEANGKSMQQVIPLIMKANQQLRQKDLSFTSDETSLLMDILTSTMSEAEKKKVEAMKEIMNKNRK